MGAEFRLLQRVTACLSTSAVYKMTACPGDTRTPTKSSNVPVEDSEQVERPQLPREEEAETLECESWPHFRNSRIWQNNFTSEVCVDQRDLNPRSLLPISRRRILSSRRSSTETSKESLRSRRSCTKGKTLSHGKASRMDDLLISISRSATQTNPSCTSMKS